jgi:transposase
MAARPTPTPKPKKTPKGPAAIEEYRRQVSPEGIAKAEAEARAALEKKYPGMFIPKKRYNTLIPGR